VRPVYAQPPKTTCVQLHVPEEEVELAVELALELEVEWVKERP
jgi:hypothetical protein